MTWLTDSRGNKCSVEYFGTSEAAQQALDSLTECDNCTNCSDCSGCSDCYGCFGCSDCSRCYDCYDLKGASPVEGNAESIEVPVIPNIHKAVYEAASQPTALAMENWHTCANTHCRAGWVVTLAGPAGKALESRYDTLLAAMKIYDASDPNFKINPCRFFDDNEAALADMKRLAEL